MANSYFSTDPYEWVSNPADLFNVNVLRDWLIQYARFSQTAPEMIESLKQNAAEFRMVPIPARLFRAISADAFGGLFGSSAAGDFFATPTFDPYDLDQIDPSPTLRDRISTMTKTRSVEGLIELVTAFAEALEQKDDKDLLQLMSDQYQDFLGRNKAKLQEAIGGLMKETKNRKVIIAETESLDAIGDKVGAIVKGAWQADIRDEDERTRSISEIFRLELIFEEDAKGNWKIASISKL